jgi:hypothetical protein
MTHNRAVIQTAVIVMLGGITLAVFGVVALIFSAQRHAETLSVEAIEEELSIPNSVVRELGIEDDVHSYLKEFVGISSFGDEVFCSFEVMGSEDNGQDRMVLYLWSLCSELYVAGGEIQEGGGVSQPLVLVLDKKDGHYSVTEHREPERGPNYASSAKALFPPDYYSQVLPDQAQYQEVNERHKLLSQWVKQKGAEYYGL